MKTLVTVLFLSITLWAYTFAGGNKEKSNATAIPAFTFVEVQDQHLAVYLIKGEETTMLVKAKDEQKDAVEAHVSNDTLVIGFKEGYEPSGRCKVYVTYTELK
ncbi:MAG: hypothetical protein HC896_12310, partial [Bacteroidales bacterium]|nr:hypothetical protein [Bacteroidales bacterium]